MQLHGHANLRHPRTTPQIRHSHAAQPTHQSRTSAPSEASTLSKHTILTRMPKRRPHAVAGLHPFRGNLD